MSPSGPREDIFPDWILSARSNVHIVRDRASFIEYTPFNTFATNVAGARSAAAIAVGTVEIQVKRAAKKRGPRSHRVLRLHNGLHVPDAVCNVVGGTVTGEDFSVELGARNEGSDARIRNGSDYVRLAYFVKNQYSLLELRLSNPPVGPRLGLSRLDMEPSGVYNIHVIWPVSERRRFEAFKEGLNHRVYCANNIPSSQPYTAEEKLWLKKHYGGDFKFLQVYGLSIYKDEDCEEGRAIARALMRGDESDEDVPGFPFTHDELVFTEKRWGDMANFMTWLRLARYNKDDCETAKTVVGVLMAVADRKRARRA
ncbi:hypothetical protein B0T22DRAFT_190028 [Podospora appendiculata]|uniref:Uncharacterized protein n=1 Tax=Podospora appendiculata TaxID=314037 RepID=A0AAE0XCN0_9PEZI|nr:hypothetical protein B0T22DRAFT_190028 [Podospora appendiculata]